jgi:hypothetical protein
MRLCGHLLLSLLVLWCLPAQASSKRTGIVIHTSVAGARVLVDGDEEEAAAKQELFVSLTPGAHSVRVEHDGFVPWEQQVNVKKGERRRVEVLLKVVPPLVKEVVAPPVTKPVEVPAGPKVARAIRVGVYEVKTNAGVDPKVAGVVYDALLAEVRKLDRISAISMAEIGEMLSVEQKRQLLGCDQESCLAEIAGAMGVDDLVTSDISTLGDSRMFTIRRIDMVHAAVKGSVTKRLKAGNGEELLSAIGPALEELYPEYPLRAGRQRGVAPAVEARLNPPPLPKPVFFSAAGATVAALLVGGYFGLAEHDAQVQHDLLLNHSVSGIDLQQSSNTVKSRATAANIAFGVGGGLAVATGVIALFTDWHGYANSPHNDEKMALRVVPNGLMLTWK